MPQLETIAIKFYLAVPNRDVERQLTTHMSIIAPVTLPNLRYFEFRGVSTYLEALVHRITSPRLEKLRIDFFHQLTFPVPRLLQFMNTTENLKFDKARVKFSETQVCVDVYSHRELKMDDFYLTFQNRHLNLNVHSRHLDWQVSSMAQISHSLSQMFSAVEDLTLEHEVHDLSSEEHNEADRTEWRKLFSSFNSVKTLRIADGLVDQLSRCLQPDDGEFPLELLPELQEVTYSGSGTTGDAFTSFIEARQNENRPITVARHDRTPAYVQLSDHFDLTTKQRG